MPHLKRDRPGISAAASRVCEPAALRAVFSRNLHKMTADVASISGLCRTLGINRTQFNRYLSGESFPRPDVLARICRHFDVDARVLLEPVERLTHDTYRLLGHPVLHEFFDEAMRDVPESLLPGGLYQYFRPSFMVPDRYAMAMVRIWRRDGCTFLRGFEPRRALREQGLPVVSREREYRGMFLRQGDGVMALISNRGAMASTFVYLAHETSGPRTVWEGFAARSMREKPTGRRVARLVFDHLGEDHGRIMACARHAGLLSEDELPSFCARLLQPGVPFR